MMKSEFVFAVLLMTGASAFTAASVWSQGMPGGQEPSQERGGPGTTGGEKWSTDEIRRVQQALKEKGHDPGEIDGKMSRQTTAAIRSFQQSQGLQATGELDDRTLKSLGVEKGEKAPDGMPGGGETPRGRERDGRGGAGY